MLHPVILAGGAGSRLWPLSRAARPKPFIEFPPRRGSLFQNTVRRLERLPDRSGSIIVCRADHRFVAAGQLEPAQRDGASILVEPVGRGTAPAAALAALSALERDEDAELLVLPADHQLDDEDALAAAVACGRALSAAGRLVTFGIEPDRADTGYGYIERGPETGDGGAFEIARFTEKPPADAARAWVAGGRHYWNSGMFLFRAEAYLAELERSAPDIRAACLAAFDGRRADDGFVFLPPEAFAGCRADSIDYAVMEKARGAAVVPLAAGWRDLGAWDAMWEAAERDGDGNALTGDALAEGAAGCYIHAGSRLVAAVGVKDAVIVETPDAVLVADRARAQDVRRIAARLEADGRPEAAEHAEVRRPWGAYRTVTAGEGFQVKRIVVEPGAALSLQRHRRRAEHWTVVRGEGVVTRDGEEIPVKANESVFIPLGSVHRLANPGGGPLEIVEVQVGDYLGEDDIERLEDRYGRA